MAKCITSLHVIVKRNKNGLGMYLREIYNVATENAKFRCRVSHPLFQTLHFIAQALVDAWSRRTLQFRYTTKCQEFKKNVLFI